MSKSKTIAIKDTYKSALTALFIAANVGLPHLFHLIPGGGIMFLPIYFFTAVASVCYGSRMGILTALMSPITGYLIFDAPRAVLIPDMILKGILLSLCIEHALKRARSAKERYCAIPIAVATAWIVAGLLELLFRNYTVAFQDFHTGIPGMVLMTIGGWIALFINKRIA